MWSHPVSARASGGFSLVELMVAFAIVGILTSLAAHNYRMIIDRTAAQVRLRSLAVAFEAVANSEGTSLGNVLISRGIASERSWCPMCTDCGFTTETWIQDLRQKKLLQPHCKTRMREIMQNLGVDQGLLDDPRFEIAIDPNEGEDHRFDDCTSDCLYATSKATGYSYVYCNRSALCLSKGPGFQMIK